MTNLEFYKEEIKKEIMTQSYSHATSTYESLVSCYKKHCNKNLIADGYKILDWLCEEYQILDKKEKEYLSAVIKPFRDRKVCLCKLEDNYTNDQFEMICINVKQLDDKRYGHFLLPFFKKSTMYKGMELNKKYTLKELGL